MAWVLALCLPVMAMANEAGPPAQPPAAEAKPLDAATMAALGITESPAVETVRSPRPVAPESGTWSWTPGQYSYDGSGNITAIGTEASFLYDVRGRLVDANLTRGSATEHRGYAYDPFGNRTSMTVGTSPVPTPTSTSTNHLTGLSAVYDAAGNVIQLQPPGQSTVYQQKFDGLGALQEVKAANVTGTPTQLHIYTADDERLWTFDLAANASHWKIRDLQGKVLRDYHVAGTTWTLSRDYIYRDGSLLAAVTPNETLHFSLDHLGTPRVITGANRNRLGFHYYLPFGEEWTDQSGAQEGEVMKFTGHERDPDVVSGGVNGFDYMHARYYSANVGRFLSVDPVVDIEEASREPQLWNRYSYVTNNPLKFTDPDGRYRTFYKEKPLSAANDWDQHPSVSWAFYAQATLLSEAAGEVAGGWAAGLAGRFFRAVAGELRLSRGVMTALKSADAATRLEGEAAVAVSRSLTGFQKVVTQGGKVVGEIDVETTKAIIEVTGGASPRKLQQITNLIGNKALNPEGKQVVVYAPNLGRQAAAALEKAGAKVVRTLDELKAVAQ